MEDIPFTSSFTIPRTPPQSTSSQTRKENQVKNPESSIQKHSPIALRTRSKSVDVRSQSEKGETDSIDLVSPEVSQSLSILQDPKLSKQLLVRLERLQETNFNSDTPVRKEEFIMANLSYTDLINAIPHFDGNERDLESFINSCDIYHRYLSEEQAGLFLRLQSRS